ncbi:hypothetical protein H9P43_009430 [Blastocladiella emersonii ATCC 22665]|nr:hypothetical protein H9P43_009390 [Blastocladiella emersonii ATCC 22665]KAI9152634.1 hypothetical protein H9P43_009430 [Blastocladiella emersonii ATCC 22665]
MHDLHVLAWLPAIVLNDPNMRDAALQQVRAKGSTTARMFLSILLNHIVGSHTKTLYSPTPREESQRCTLEVHASWTAAMTELHRLIREVMGSAYTPTGWFPPDRAGSVRIIAQAKGRSGLQGRTDDELAEYPNGVCPRCRVPVVPRLKQAFRFLFRAEPAASLAELGPDTVLPLDFWELVPDGALDGVKDAKWLMKMARSTKHQLDADTARAVFCELRHVAPVTTAGAVESLFVSLELQ